MNPIISSKLYKLLEVEDDPIKVYVYFIDLISNKENCLVNRLRSKKDLQVLSQNVKEKMLTEKIVPYQISVLMYPGISKIDDEFFHGVPHIKVIYSKVFLYQEIMKTGNTARFIFPNGQYLVRSGREEILGAVKEANYNIAIVVGDTVLIPRYPQGDLGFIDSGEDIHFLVTDRSGKKTEVTVKSDGRYIKSLIREYLSTQEILPDSIFTNDDRNLGSKILGVQADRRSVSDLEKVFDLAQAIRDVSSSLAVVTGLDSGTSVLAYTDISQSIWEIAKTDNRISISSVSLDTDYYIYLT